MLPLETSSKFSQDPRSCFKFINNVLKNGALAEDFLAIYCSIAFSTLRNHARAKDALAIYLGIALSPNISSQFTRESRLNVPLARPACQGPPARPALPAETSHNVLGTPAPAQRFLEE